MAHIYRCDTHLHTFFSVLDMHNLFGVLWVCTLQQALHLYHASTNQQVCILQAPLHKCVVYTMQAPFSKCVILHSMLFTQYKHPFRSVQLTNALQKVRNLHNASTRRVCVRPWHIMLKNGAIMLCSYALRITLLCFPVLVIMLTLCSRKLTLWPSWHVIHLVN